MQEMTVIDKEALYGKKILSFKIVATAEQFNAQFAPTTIDVKRSGVAPADGCDIIIGGFSTKTASIFALNKNLVEDNTQFTTFSGIFNATFHGYCDESEKGAVEAAFKAFIKPRVFDFCKKQLSQITALTDLYIG